MGSPWADQHSGSGVSFPSRFNRLNDMQNNYQLMFLSSTRWVSLRMELMANLVTLAVALFVALGASSASHSYQALTISLILQVREGLGQRARCGEHAGRPRGPMGLWFRLGLGHA